MNVMRDLTPDEDRMLVDTIKRFGVVVPVLVNRATGEVIDGHNRMRVAKALGVECPVVAIDTDEPDALARALNVARRHLSRDERRAYVTQLRAEGMSGPSIANATGVSESTVFRDLAQSGSPNGEPHRTVGRDGKTYPAKRSPTKKASAPKAKAPKKAATTTKPKPAAEPQPPDPLQAHRVAVVMAVRDLAAADLPTPAVMAAALLDTPNMAPAMNVKRAAVWLTALGKELVVQQAATKKEMSDVSL